MECRTIQKLNEEDIMFIKQWLEPYVPWVAERFSSVQLTLSSLLWSVLLIISGYLARSNKLWFLLSIIALIMHMVTDILDGRVSEYLNDGMCKWNFFMDHLLDFVLAVAVFIGLSSYYYGKSTSILLCIFAVFALVVINMAASFLMVAEQGLDLGITVDDRISFNIFYMHFILIAFYIYSIVFVSHNKSNDPTVFVYIIIIFLLLTVFNIYKKQSLLIEQ